VGMQREWVQSQLAGIRTFALLTVFGAVSACRITPFYGLALIAGLGCCSGLARDDGRAAGQHHEEGFEDQGR